VTRLWLGGWAAAGQGHPPFLSLAMQSEYTMKVLPVACVVVGKGVLRSVQSNLHAVSSRIGEPQP